MNMQRDERAASKMQIVIIQGSGDFKRLGIIFKVNDGHAE